MFYSHELLTSRQYGVATIWLVATIGNKPGARRVGKKAIQGVDVQRACRKIIEPGAPIALRLQGNLLFGVSKVYQEQCSYILTDAQKIQGHMMTFLRQISANQLAPGAATARQVFLELVAHMKIEKKPITNHVCPRPENLIIMDDPDFLPDGRIPDPTADMFILSQHTNKTSSQMSPRSMPSQGSSSGNERVPIQLDFRDSSVFDNGASPHGLQGLSSGQKPAVPGDQADVFGEDGIGIPIDYGMEIDEFGNIIESAEPGPDGLDELELPPMHSIGGGQKNQPQLDEEGDIIMMEEQPLPEAEALPDRAKHKEPDPVAAGEHEQRQAPAQRRKKRRIIYTDEETEISRAALRDWQKDYLKNCTVPKSHPVTAPQAKANAIHLTFGWGIANIGQTFGVPGIIHPLALHFSGDRLFTAYTGLDVFEKGRRKRTRSEARSRDEEHEERRIRPRLEGDSEQQGRGLEEDGMLEFGQGDQQSPPEVGREAQSALEDVHSSAMPWNRGSSLMPGSSIQKLPSMAQPGREQSSPLRSKAGSVQDIIRYSDDVDMGGFDFGADGGLGSVGSSFDGLPDQQPPESLGEQPVDKQAESQYTRDALDREGKNFLAYMEETLHEAGVHRYDEDLQAKRKWVEFDEVFLPKKTDRPTAAQAFYHILTLVTKGQMRVEQEVDDGQPFGTIHVGLDMPRGA
ncbi:hypothetical protein JX266_002707 [Neoarthrinium moseri]|nr:hypothetical protein JX266_002707 [Neoarthrinium moseri]